MIWKRIFGRAGREDVAFALYGVLVAQARMPGFYLRAGVPDTLEGRFEMLMIHVFLVLRRLKAAGGPAKALGQRLFDILFDDMDQTLREIGVGDLSVGKKIKAMASSFYGRIAAYDAGLDADGTPLLEDAVRRNVFAEMEPEPAKVAMLADYMRRSAEILAQESDDALMTGRAVFAPFAEEVAS